MFQIQTAECMILGELLINKVIVVLNKVDKLPEKDRETLVATKID